MKKKLCGITDEREMFDAVAAGADLIGFQVGQKYAGKHFILGSTAVRLARQLPVFNAAVLVTHHTAPEMVRDLVLLTGVRTVQLCAVGEEDAVKLLDSVAGSLRLIQTLSAAELREKGGGEADWSLFAALSLNLSSASAGEMESVAEFPAARDFVEQFIASVPIPVLLSGEFSDGEYEYLASRCPNVAGVDRLYGDGTRKGIACNG